MKVKRTISLLITTLLLLTAVCPSLVLAASFTENITTSLLAFQDFESYDTGYEMTTADGYAYGTASVATAVDKSDIVSFSGNKCIAINASSALRAENWQLINYDTAKMSTVVMGFSIYADEMASNVYTTVKTGAYGNVSFKLKSSGRIALGETDTDVTLAMDTWYDVVVEHVPAVGYIRAHIKGGTVDKFCEASFTPTANTKDTARLTFIADKVNNSENHTSVYIDNFYAYASNKKPTEYVGALDGYTFEDFVAASDGLTFPEGMVPDNTNNYIELYTEATDTSGKCLKISTNAAKWPTLRTTVSENGLSGKSVLEFDYKASSTCKTRFGIRGADSAGNSINNTVSLIGFIGNGKLKVTGTGASYDVADAQVLTTEIAVDTWYHYKFEFDTDAYTWKVTATSPGKDTVTYSGDIPLKDGYNPTYKIKQLDMQNNGVITTDYIDNIYFKSSDAPFGVSSIESANSLITPDTSSVKINYNANAQDNIETCIYKINGEKNKVTVSSSDSVVTLTFKEPLEFGTHYLVEVCGIDKKGKEFYAVTSVRTVKELDISQFEYSVSSMQSGSITASSTITANSTAYTDATLITLLLNKQTGALVSANFDKVALSKGVPANLSSSLTVPLDYTSYKIVSYLWDTTEDMNTLAEPVALN